MRPALAQLRLGAPTSLALTSLALIMLAPAGWLASQANADEAPFTA
jgi:hypothetical protein